MPRRLHRHPAKRGRDRLRLAATPEASSSRASTPHTSTPRIDSVVPGSLAVTPPAPAPATKNGAVAAWTYYSRNSSLERKRKLLELALKYGCARAASVLSEESLGSSLDEFSDFADDDEEDRGESEEQDTRLGSRFSGLVSLLSLPPSHPFAGTTTMEQRQIIWDDLQTYSGASTPTPILAPRPSPAQVQYPSLSTFDAPSLPSSLSFSTLRPTSGADTDEDEWEDDEVNRARRNAISKESKPIFLSSSGPKERGRDEVKGKGKAKLLETLCCRAQTGTPVCQSRLPVRVGAAIPVRRRFKMKKGLVRMSLDSRDDLGEGSSSHIPLIHPNIGAVTASILPLPAEPQSANEDEVQAHSLSSSSPSLPSSSSEGNQQSLEERLRNTTLEDLPLSQQDAEEVRELVAEPVRDRAGMSGTWPPRAQRRLVMVEARGG